MLRRIFQPAKGRLLRYLKTNTERKVLSVRAICSIGLFVAFVVIPMNTKPACCELLHPESPVSTEQKGTCHIANKDGSTMNQFSVSDEPPEPTTPDNLCETWGEFPSTLKERGVSFEIEYTGESYTTTGDGLRKRGDIVYAGLLDLFLALDTEKLGLWPDGRFFFQGQNRHGQDIVKHNTPHLDRLSDITAPPFTQLSEYGIEQSFMDERLRLKLGRQDANSLFCAMRYSFHFVIPSFTLIPTAPIPTFPFQALGAAVFADPAKWLSLGVGIYDGSTTGGFLGFDNSFKSTFTVFEPAWKHNFGADGQYPGTYRLGLWYHSGSFTEISSDPRPENVSGNYGYYLAFDQLLYKKKKGVANESAGDSPKESSDDMQGLGMFTEFGWAPSDRNELVQYYGIGFSYTGSFRAAIPTNWESALTTPASAIALWLRVTRKARPSCFIGHA